jgi:KaiC/GvpD/RAD55 family RecA-like ATPase
MSATGELRSPYQGLDPYGEEDAPYFFGREPECNLGVANLMACRLTLLYGPSGVGKTSLVHAGVVHHLRSLVRANIAERGAPELAVAVFSSWRDDPVEGLASSIRDAMAQLPGLTGGETSLRPSRLDQTIEAATARLGGELLVVLDQFEEYFLYHDHQRDQGSFVTELSRAVNRWDLRVSVLISIREDALAKLDRFKGLIPNLFDNYLRVEHLDLEAARMAIEGPVEQYNQELGPGSQHVRIEPGLADEVLRQVRTGEVTRALARAGASPTGTDARVEAPYLQLVMSRLWEEEIHAGSHVLRLDTLATLGGAERIVFTHLDDAMSGLSRDEQDTAGTLFRYLVTPSGSKIAHTSGDLAEYTEMPESALDPVLEKLSRWETRILRPAPPAPGRSGATRYEIFHDVLAPAILDWRVRHLQARELERVQRIASTFGVLTGHTGPVGRVVFSPNGLFLASSSDDHTVRLWDLGHPGATPVVLPGHEDSVRSVAFSPDGRTLASGSDDHTARLWDLGHPGATPVVLRGHESTVWSVAFSPDGRALASGSVDRTVRLWDLGHPGAAPVVLRGHESFVTSVAFSPDGRILASGSGDGSVRLWDLGHPGAAPVVLGGHESFVTSVAFSPDGRILASGSYDHTVRLWDLGHPGAVPDVLRDHESFVTSVAFSPDGRTLASASNDRTVRLWNLGHPGAASALLKGNGGAVNSVAFSPDGTLIATGNDDGTTRLRVLPAGGGPASSSP